MWQKAPRKCRRCGHPRQNCPAKEATSFKCKKRGHISAQCLSKGSAAIRDLSTKDDTQEEESSEIAYLNTLTGSNEASWNIEVNIGGKSVQFKVDTGAEVSAISESSWKSF